MSHLFSKLHIKILARAGPNGDPHSHTINLFIEFVVKHKKRFFDGHGKEITKNILRDLRGILVIFIQTINANINGFVQWNGMVYLFIDFNLVACDFLKFDWCKMLNGYVYFSFNIFSLRMTVESVETLEN